MADESEVLYVRLDKIRAGGFQYRAAIDEGGLDDLAASIARRGVIQPVVLARSCDGFIVVAGHRRVAACRKLGRDTIPAVVSRGGEAEQREVSFAENFHRAETSAVETAAAIKDVVGSGEMTVERVAGVFNRSEAWVNSMLQLAEWPGDVLKCIHEGRFSVSAGRSLALIDDDDYRGFLIRQACANGVTARTTASWLQGFRQRVPPQAAVERGPLPGMSPPPQVTAGAPCFLCCEHKRLDGLSTVYVCPECFGRVRERQE